jgi:hypothetical protein
MISAIWRSSTSGELGGGAGGIGSSGWLIDLAPAEREED